jgi:hypothetical protein
MSKRDFFTDEAPVRNALEEKLLQDLRKIEERASRQARALSRTRAAWERKVAQLEKEGLQPAYTFNLWSQG